MQRMPKRLLYPLLLAVIGLVLSACGGTSKGGGPALTVNSADDADDGVCDDSHCSLREAIRKANTLSGTVTIRFDIGGGGLQTIRPESALPAILVPVDIDGSTQAGSSSSPLIELDGSLAAGTLVNGLELRGGASTVQALVINGFSGNGIQLMAAGENHVRGCYIGTDSAGTTAKPNGLDGVNISDGENNVIGGTGTHDGNVLSGNGNEGVSDRGEKTTLLGNTIGLNAAGDAAVPNQGAGVGLTGDDAVIGGTAPGSGNVISGNEKTGVLFFSEAEGGVVAGNLIGTDKTGTIAIGNRWGVAIGASNVTVGGDTAAERNVISGNLEDGIRIPSGSGNRIQGNYIGTDITGMAALGNGGAGVWLYSYETTIGGVQGTTGNVISANGGPGVWVYGESGNQNNRILGNLIGLNAAGNAALGNQGSGVQIDYMSVVIGGVGDGEGNVISGNEKNGVRIDDGSSCLIANFIGTDITGSVAIGNLENGVSVGGGSAEDWTIVGEGFPGTRNVISGNQLNGVFLDDTSREVVVYDNYIGTDAAGTKKLANGQSGVSVGGSGHRIGFSTFINLISGNPVAGIRVRNGAEAIRIQNNYIGTDISGKAALGNGVGIQVDTENTQAGIQIGGATTGQYVRNLISGNQREGLILHSGASVWGNFIGTDISGENPLANGGDGIRIRGSMNEIGGSHLGNAIAFNGGNGVAVISDASAGGFPDKGTAAGNSILHNSIHDNDGLGIAIAREGVLANDNLDPDGGDNLRQNYPVLTSAFLNPGTDDTTVVGELESMPSTLYIIEIFANDACDPSGYGEGRRLVQWIGVVTDDAGFASISATVYVDVAPGEFITATATDPRGNTSEFSQCVKVESAPLPSPVEQAGIIFKPSADPHQVLAGGCEPSLTRIAVEVVNPPEEIGYVMLFVRLLDPLTGTRGAWSEGLSMLAPAENRFYYDLSVYDIPEHEKFTDAVLQYQFVVYNKAQTEIGRSGVYEDIAFAQCGAAAEPTPTRRTAG